MIRYRKFLFLAKQESNGELVWKALPRNSGAKVATNSISDAEKCGGASEPKQLQEDQKCYVISKETVSHSVHLYPVNSEIHIYFFNKAILFFIKKIRENDVL